MLTITLTIIIVTCLVSVAAFSNQKVTDDLIFWPAAMNTPRQSYRFFTYGFIHADYMHLAFNMISLWSFGQFLEQYFNVYTTYATIFLEKGKFVYIALYVLAIIVSVIPDYFKNRSNYAYRALGASGAVSAVIFASIALEPTIPLRFFFIPFDIPGWIFGLAFLVLSTYLAKRGKDNIGHGAHITGAIFGLVYTIIVCKVFADYDVVTNLIRAIKGN